jgi:hypothetical protein
MDYLPTTVVALLCIVTHTRRSSERNPKCCGDLDVSCDVCVCTCVCVHMCVDQACMLHRSLRSMDRELALQANTSQADVCSEIVDLSIDFCLSVCLCDV